MPDDPREQLAEHLRHFGELGVTGVSRDPVWRRRADGEGTAAAADDHGAREMVDVDPKPSVEPAGPVGPPGEELSRIRAELGDCTRCKLHGLGRRQIVFGVGSPDAALMFVGEAPGQEEDVQGLPFVGRAGQLLTKIIESIGLTRDQVYIANVIKCRPPKNRNPEPDEVDRCEPFLFAQVDAIHPKVIVAMGAFAAQTLLRSDTPISRLRGRLYDYRGAQLVATFHPAYLLRNAERKRDVWEDMKRVRALLEDAESVDYGRAFTTGG